MKRNLITILALIIALSSCNDDALFEKEMYKNVVALISSDYYNTFEEVVTLSPTGEEATGYIAACTGGTHAPKKNMVIGLEEDLTSLEFYNRSLYDVVMLNSCPVTNTRLWITRFRLMQVNGQAEP